MANTPIKIKRSLSTSTPVSLNIGEPAYSYSSNTLFIGTPAGTGSIPIGGYDTYLRGISALDTANNALIVADTALAQAQKTNAAFNHANSGFIQANAAYQSQNATGQYANAAFIQSNSAFIKLLGGNSI